MRILITGGAGFIGSNLATYISQMRPKVQISVLDDFSNGSLDNLESINVEVIEGSILEILKIEELKNYQFDVIYHLAARGSVPRSIKFPSETIAVNVQGTLQVLEFAKQNGSKLVFSSSSSVYGDGDENVLKHERANCNPMSPYAASKLSSEVLISTYARLYGLETMIFRFFNVFGPFQKPNSPYAAVIPRWIHSAMRDEDLVIYGDGLQSRDFTFVEDVVKVLDHSIFREDKVNQSATLVNLAFGSSITLLDLITELKKSFPSLRVNFQPERKGDVMRSCSETEIFKNSFPDLKPTPFTEALSKTIKWYKEGRPLSN